MSSHLRSFYQDDGSGGAGATGPAASTPQHDSSEYKKRIVLLNKKLRAYEKRRQKLLYEENQREKEQQPAPPQSTTTELTTQQSEEAGLNNSSKLIPSISVQAAATLPSAIRSNQSSNNLPKRNGSFAFQVKPNEEEPQTTTTSRVDEQSKVWFDLSNDNKLNSSIGASGSFDASAATVTGSTDPAQTAAGATPVNDDSNNTGGQSNGHLVNNSKSYQSLEKNMVFLIHHSFILICLTNFLFKVFYST